MGWRLFFGPLSEEEFDRRKQKQKLVLLASG